MKRNDHLFSTPTRQSIFAIVFIVLKYIRIIVRQIWPVLLVFVFGGSSSRKLFLIILVIGIAIISMIWAIIAYFKYTFHISENELIVEKGVLRRTKTNIPFDRIQTVNFQQNILHQFFNVIQLDVDTAGSQGSEFSFDALSKEKAHELRKLLLSRRKQGAAVAMSDIGEPSHFERDLVLKLEIKDLLKIGVSQNHIRSGALIFAGLFWVLESLDDVGFATGDMIENAYKESLQTGLFLIMAILAILLVISFMISLVRTVVKYFDLSLYRQDNRYQLISGLLTKKEFSIIDHKIQIMQWNDNLIKKVFGFFDVNLKQASSIQVVSKKSIHIPGCYPHHIDFIKHNWLGNKAVQSLDKTGVSIHYFYRRVLFRMLFCLAVIAALYFLDQKIFFIMSFLLIPYFIYTSWISYQKAGFAVNDHVVFVCKGMFGDDYSIMPIYKIQSLKVKRTPYQSRNDLSSLQIFTASGGLVVPYIPYSTALKLHDYLLHQAEVSKQRWM